ncbi:hypothetical protein Hanom_Chr05g00430181 [Helianthus anomalus]
MWSPDCLVDTKEPKDVYEEALAKDKDSEEHDGFNVNAAPEIAVENGMIDDSDATTDGTGLNVHEVTSNQFSEGIKNSEIRRKRGSFERKKVDRSKSNSPTGCERPKKKEAGIITICMTLNGSSSPWLARIRLVFVLTMCRR